MTNFAKNVTRRVSVAAILAITGVGMAQAAGANKISQAALPKASLAATIINPNFKAIKKSMFVTKTPLSAYTDVIQYAKSLGITKIYWGGFLDGDYGPQNIAWMAQTGIAGPNATVFTMAMANAGLTTYAISSDGATGFYGSGNQNVTPQPVIDLRNMAVTYPGIIAGICLDYEPHIRDEWKIVSNRDSIATVYASRIALARSYLNSNPVSPGKVLALEALTHPSYAGQYVPNTGNTMLQAALAQLDASVLMSYRNTAGAYLQWISNSGQLLQTLNANKPFSIALTTNPQNPNSDPNRIGTFSWWQSDQDTYATYISGAVLGLPANLPDRQAAMQTEMINISQTVPVDIRLTNPTVSPLYKGLAIQAYNWLATGKSWVKNGQTLTIDALLPPPFQ